MIRPVSSRTVVALLFLLCSYCHVRLVSPLDQTVVWTFDAARPGGRYGDLTFKTGDTITFSWPGGAGGTAGPTHDVNLHLMNTCDTEGTNELQADAAGPKDFKYKFENTGDFFFACDVGPHCTTRRMLLKAHVCGFWDRILAWVLAIFTLFLVQAPCLLV
jgi:hypothetical protein